MGTSTSFTHRVMLRDALAVPALIESLSSNNIMAKFRTINVLKKIGPAARPAVPHLKALLTAEEWYTKVIRFKAALLKQGQNKIVLSHAKRISRWSSISYDYLKLENIK